MVTSCNHVDCFRRASWALAWIAVLCIGRTTADDGWVDGDLTNFGTPQELSEKIPESLPNAACGYGNMPRSDYPFYALGGISKNNQLYYNRPMKGCGTCLEVRCTAKQTCLDRSKTLQMMVFDNCGGNCQDTQLNIHALGFLQLAPMTVGRIAVQYRQVPCTFTGGVKVNVLDYRASGGGYVKVAFKNVAGDGGLKTVELSEVGKGNWVGLHNSYGAVWEGSGLPGAPMDIRLTDSTGKQATLGSIIAWAGQTGELQSSQQLQ